MSEEIIIRNATSADSKKLSILFKQVYIKTYGVEGVSDEFANFITEQFSVPRIENTIASNPDALLVAEYKNNLVGVLEIEYDKPCPVEDIVAPEINKIYILEWFCNRGIGEMLMEKAETLLKEKGYSQLWIWLLESNLRALSFYKKHNYIEIGKAPFEMEVNTYQNIVMLKTL